MNKYIFTVSYQTPLLLSQSYTNSGDIMVVREDEDNKPPYCSLSSPHLTELEKPVEVWARALALLNIYNGSNNLIYNPHGNFDTYAIQNITGLYIWKTNTNITPNNSIEILPSKPFDINLIDYPLDKTTDPNDDLGKLRMVKSDNRTHAIYLAKTNDDVKYLLLQLGNGLDWINLYCILDTIKYYTDSATGLYQSILTDCSLTTSDIKAFTGTANNFGLIGISARHGNLGWSTPSRTVDLKEGQSIILKLVNSYLKLKHYV